MAKDYEFATRRALEGQLQHLELNPDDYGAQMFVAIQLLEVGEEERAHEVAETLLSARSEDSFVLYGLGCFYSLAGNTDRALDVLEMAVDAGDRTADWWRQDSDLDNVRDDPRFDELLARMEADS